MGKIHALDSDITIVTEHGSDYICLTDMLKAKDGISLEQIDLGTRIL